MVEDRKSPISSAFGELMAFVDRLSKRRSRAQSLSINGCTVLFVPHKATEGRFEVLNREGRGKRRRAVRVPIRLYNRADRLRVCSRIAALTVVR